MGGGLVIRAMPELKSFYSLDVFSYPEMSYVLFLFSLDQKDIFIESVSAFWNNFSGIFSGHCGLKGFGACVSEAEMRLLEHPEKAIARGLDSLAHQSRQHRHQELKALLIWAQ